MEVLLLDKKLLQTLSSLVSKMPKKDLEKNIEKAKNVLKNSKKEDLEKLLSNPQISKLLGKDANNLKDSLKNIDLNKLDVDELSKKLQKEN